MSRLPEDTDPVVRVGDDEGAAQQRGERTRWVFYVQSDDVVGTRIRLDFTVDPPPEIAVEVDLHHDSTSKLRNYCRAWRTSEVWRYDSIQMAMPHLDGETYVPVATSRALPMLTAARPTEYLTRKRDEG